MVLTAQMELLIAVVRLAEELPVAGRASFGAACFLKQPGCLLRQLNRILW